MSNNKADIGVYGLSVMGSSLARNIASRNFTVSLYNRTREKAEKLYQEHPSEYFILPKDLSDFVASLERPRRILLMVNSNYVDESINSLIPYLEEGDIIIDGGNSFYGDTSRRQRELAVEKIQFLGIGVSGGEEGALRGPSIMPGGERSAYRHVAPILDAIAAKIGDESCVDYLGNGGIGHLVKMVHNGIEYGDMQLIAEVYHILKAAKISNHEICEIFTRWNEEKELNSFLIEITADIFNKKEGDSFLVDLILDKAKQKGTGRWTIELAQEVGIAVPTLAAAVDARLLSAQKAARVSYSKRAPHINEFKFGIAKDELVRLCFDSLVFGKIASYSQGFHLISEGDLLLNRETTVPLAKVARIWRAGCIIRSALLDDMAKAFEADSGSLLMFTRGFVDRMQESQSSIRTLLGAAINAGVPVPCLSSSLSYYDAMRSEVLPQNLTQAQRDYFGAHTFERKDKPGFFHESW